MIEFFWKSKPVSHDILQIWAMSPYESVIGSATHGGFGVIVRAKGRQIVYMPKWAGRFIVIKDCYLCEMVSSFVLFTNFLLFAQALLGNKKGR